MSNHDRMVRVAFGKQLTVDSFMGERKCFAEPQFEVLDDKTANSYLSFFNIAFLGIMLLNKK